MLLKTSYKMKPPVSAKLKSGHPLADKLIACYLFNEGSGIIAHDSSGRGHHGTLTGGATWVTGKYGPAIDLDGTDGYIVVPDHADFTPASSPLSIAVRGYMHSTVNFCMGGKGTAVLYGEWEFTVGAGSLVFFRAFKGSVQECWIGQGYLTSLAPYANQWVDLVATYDGGTVSSGIVLYLNVVHLDTIDFENKVGSFDGVENHDWDVLLGMHDGDYTDGIFDSMMIWRRVLTPSDIAKLNADRFCMFEQRARVIAGAAK